jgi:hypothetical protein
VVVTEEETGHREEIDAVDEEHPRGTFVLTMVFILMLVAAWAFTYATLIGRG